MKKSAQSIVLPIILVLILAAVGYFGVWPWWKMRGSWQAVFLTNNQVYFGHLSLASGRFVELTEVHYLQVRQGQPPPQPLQEGQPPPTQITLVRLGGEPHGPEREMFISRDNILFWENLRDDSQVVVAIKTLKEQQQ